LRDTFRAYFTAQIEPHVPAMERGEMLPYPLMREMHQALGLDQMMASIGGGGGKGSAGGAGGFDANTARYARTTFTVEMSRVSPSFALSYGASLGLFGANVARQRARPSRSSGSRCRSCAARRSAPGA
jgi:hypothetical protein